MALTLQILGWKRISTILVQKCVFRNVLIRGKSIETTKIVQKYQGFWRKVAYFAWTSRVSIISAFTFFCTFSKFRSENNRFELQNDHSKHTLNAVIGGETWFSKVYNGFYAYYSVNGTSKITFLSKFEKKVAKKSVFLDLRVITEFWKMENHDFSGFFRILEFWISPNFHSISRPINWGGGIASFHIAD